MIKLLIPRSKKKLRKLKPVKPSRAAELNYRKKLLAIVKTLSAATQKEVLPILQKGDLLTNSQYSELRRALEIMAGNFGGIDETAKRLSSEAVLRAKEYTDTGLVNSIKSSTGVDISAFLVNSGRIHNAVESARVANVDLITSIPSKYFGQIESIIKSGFENGIRHEALAKDIFEVAEMTERRAALIARDQMAKMNSDFNRIRQTDLGIKQYEWQTSGDERVRDTHADNDGKIFNWDDPPPETGNPGDDINCRCVALPIISHEIYS